MHRFSWGYHPCANLSLCDGLRGSRQRNSGDHRAMLITPARGAATARKDVRETAPSLVCRRPGPSAKLRATEVQEASSAFALELLKAHLPQCRADDSVQRVHDVLRRVIQVRTVHNGTRRPPRPRKSQTGVLRAAPPRRTERASLAPVGLVDEWSGPRDCRGVSYNCPAPRRSGGCAPPGDSRALRR